MDETGEQSLIDHPTKFEANRSRASGVPRYYRLYTVPRGKLFSDDGGSLETQSRIIVESNNNFAKVRGGGRDKLIKSNFSVTLHIIHVYLVSVIIQ